MHRQLLELLLAYETGEPLTAEERAGQYCACGKTYEADALKNKRVTEVSLNCSSCSTRRAEHASPRRLRRGSCRPWRR